MTKEENAADFLRMYKSLTDPALRENARLVEERRKRMDIKMRDTGL